MYIIKNGKVKVSLDCDPEPLKRLKVELIKRDWKLAPFIEMLIGVLSTNEQLLDILTNKEE